MDFDALKVALELIRALKPVIQKIRQHDPSLATQITRAASSNAGNLGEGRWRAGRDRIHHFRVAGGSAGEVEVHLHVALAWGYVEASDLDESMALLDRELAMCWKLIH